MGLEVERYRELRPFLYHLTARANLERIKGVGEEYADLLEVSGVDTVPELARRHFFAVRILIGGQKDR